MRQHSVVFVSILFRLVRFILILGLGALMLNPTPRLPASAAQTGSLYELVGPSGSVKFGTRIYPLSNGNLVVTDPAYNPGGLADTGAVYLYNGRTKALISTLTGSQAGDNVGGSIFPLDNGNYLVRSPNWANSGAAKAGAITYCYADTGCQGPVSPSNSLVGSTANDQLGGYSIMPLPNGNYVIINPYGSGGVATNAGSVTWCPMEGGCIGVVSASNSLVGSSSNDMVGGSGAYLLSNNHYLVLSSSWNNGGATQAGAVTWCPGDSPCVGTVSSANSLVGSSANDQVTFSAALFNGNYVAGSTKWSNGSNANAGAVRWCPANGGCQGVLTLTNSLVGVNAGDNVGFRVTPWIDGNYVISSPDWSNAGILKVGAVTWCPGDTGCTPGPVTPSNSLIGSLANDQVGLGFTKFVTINSYVVGSPNWNGVVTKGGAITWCPENTGCQGMVVSSANSRVGITANDRVGLTAAQPLTYGNYVVAVPYWTNPGTVAALAGAVTWCPSSSACIGPVSSSNSLVGTSASDRIGSYITVFANDNYLVTSPYWSNGGVGSVGAVTWCSGTGACVGAVSASNSLVGSTAGDQVGYALTVLPNKNFVISSPYWSTGGKIAVGAVTWCSGDTGCAPGPVTTANSLVGSTVNDEVGWGTGYGFVTNLVGNGNYVVSSPYWDNGSASDAGAATWCPDGGSCNGQTVSSANSLVGGTINDRVGSSIYPLTNGSFVVGSPSWTNSGVTSAGAATWCPGSAPTCTGLVSSSNSLVGSTANDYVGNSVIKISNGGYVVSSNNWSNGGVIAAGAVTLGSGTKRYPIDAITTANSLLGNVPNQGLTITNNRAIDWANGQLVVGKPAENVVSFFQPPSTSIASGDWEDPATWDFFVPTANTPTVISSPSIVTILDDNPSARDLTIMPGGTLAFSGGSLRVSGNFNNQGVFSSGNGTIIFNSGVQSITASVPTAFYNLTIRSGVTVAEGPGPDQFSYTGTISNTGILRKSQPVSISGLLSFGLTGVQVQVDTPGGLTNLQVDRMDQNAPNARMDPGGYDTRTGVYWNITPLASPPDYNLGLYLPTDLDGRASLCRYSSNVWTCDRTGSDAKFAWLSAVNLVDGTWTLGTPSLFQIFAPILFK
jgi:hypothetical protein